jgi:starch synthase
MPEPLKIVFVTPECAPWVKTGGLGDVSGALPAALNALGHDVRVLMPAYPAMKPLLPQAQTHIDWPAEGPWPAAKLALVDSGRGFPLWLLDCPALYDRAGSPYGDETARDFDDSARRFGFLSHVAARLSAANSPWPGWQADVLHGNDWPCGLAAAYLQRLPGPRAVSLFTIHNLAFQGMFSLGLSASLAIEPDWLTLDGLLHWDQLSMLKAGINFSDAVNAVSPTYAHEIQQEALGFGMDGVLRARSPHVHGILNGIDTTVWSPQSDPQLTQPYDTHTLERKAANKLALQTRTGLQREAGAMLFGLVSRLTEQKGIDLVVHNLPWLVARGAQLVVLGKGDAALEAQLQQAAEQHHLQVAVHIGFDESLAHQIEAGADAFLMPSRFEPCGLNQMYSQAYGTPPIVRATGGLADSVVDHDADPGAGTGFVFADASSDALLQAMQRAMHVYRDKPAWRALQQRGMQRNFGWDASARRYVALYEAYRRWPDG